MSFKVDTQEVYQALQALGSKYKRVENKAVNEATSYVEKTLQANTPRWHGKKYLDKKRGSYTLEHMNEHVVSSKAKDGYAEAGFDDDVAYRAHFVEFGTIKQKPQGFTQKTQKEVEEQVTEIIAENVKRGLGL